MIRIVKLAQDGSIAQTGLPKNHPLIKFSATPENVDTALLLDDTVVLGALSLMQEASDSLVSSFSKRLHDRKLFKCFDVRAHVAHKIDPKSEQSPQHVERIDKCCAGVLASVQEWCEDNKGDLPRLLVDEAERSPYNTSGGSLGPTEQINVKTDGGELIDLKQQSDVVSALKSFKLTRVYYSNEDAEALEIAIQITNREVKT